MALSRRNFMKIAGSTAIILPASACAIGPDSAHQPWHNAGEYSDPMRRALSYALLAPNPHNMQPWVVELVSEHEAILTCDLDRLLPQTDPLNRQIVIGLGCFLEQFRIAAGQFGFTAKITPFPDGHDDMQLDSRPVAHLLLRPAATSAPSPYFAHIVNRRTNRNPYLARTPDQKTLKAVTSGLGDTVTAGFTNRPEHAARLRDLAVIASNIEFNTPRTNKESVDVMRIGTRENNKNPDGIALEGPMKGALHSLGILTRKSLADPNSALFRTGRDAYAEGIKSTSAFAWLSTPTNTRQDQINAGAAYLRLTLNAVAQGLSIHPISQALQEYPEMKEALRLIHYVLDVKSGTRVQMFVRVGYAKAIGPSPRWPLEAKIKGA